MKIARSFFVLVMPWALSWAGATPDSDTSRTLQVGRRTIVQFVDNKSFEKFNGSDKVIMSLPKQNAQVMNLTPKEFDEFSKRGDVLLVEEDQKRYSGNEPTEKINPEALVETVPYGIDLVNALQVDDSPSANIGICIVDSGYDMPHDDLQQTDVTGDEQPGTPWDEDQCEHGTHVAGTILALGNNGQGVIGVIRNGESPLHIVKVFANSCFWMWSSGLVDAVQKCVDAGSKVVNMSLGSSAYSSFEDTSFATMESDGLLMIAAAGNGASSAYSYPASYDSVMSIGAVDSNSNIAYFSQYNDQVSVAGPGVGTYSTCDQNTYCTKSGTSMATPHVVGVAALVWSHFPTQFTNLDIRDALQQTATDLGTPGYDFYYGHGLVNAKAAYDYLFALSGPAPSSIPSTSVEPSESPSPTMAPSVTLRPSESCFDLDIEILPDQWASGETSWTFYDTDGVTIIDSGGLGDFSGYVLYEYTISCIPVVCGSGQSYTWTINDTFGDGLNWSSTDPGYFKVFAFGEELFGSSDGVNFGYSDSVDVTSCRPITVPTVAPLPTPSPTDTPTSTPTATPSIAVTPEPSASPSLTCSDSVFSIVYPDADIPCSFVGDYVSACLCDYDDVGSHCPVTCGTCEEYACADSAASFKAPNGVTASCSLLATLPPGDIASYCLSPDLAATCPVTCGACTPEPPVTGTVVDFEDATHLTTYPSHAPTGLTFSNWYGMDAPLYCTDCGYLSGLASGVYIAYNGFATPASMSCPGGSFTFVSANLTPAWTDFIEYRFVGTKTDGTTVTATRTLGDTMTLGFVDGFTTFTSLTSLTFESVAGGSLDHVSMDDFTVEITTPCGPRMDPLPIIKADPLSAGKL